MAQYVWYENKDNKVHIHTPYSKKFVSRVRNVRGSHWNADYKRWEVPLSELSVVKKLLNDVYGHTDETVYKRYRLTTLDEFSADYSCVGEWLLTRFDKVSDMWSVLNKGIVKGMVLKGMVFEGYLPHNFFDLFPEEKEWFQYELIEDPADVDVNIYKDSYTQKEVVRAIHHVKNNPEKSVKEVLEFLALSGSRSQKDEGITSRAELMDV